jgi:hypothetical protein
MAVAARISAEQYLRSGFEHDAEFVDGRVVQRPMAAWEHACRLSGGSPTGKSAAGTIARPT